MAHSAVHGRTDQRGAGGPALTEQHAFVSASEAVDATREAIIRRRVMAIMRSREHDAAVDIARALVAGGVRAVEITVQTESAFTALRRVREALPAEVLVGAGTVLDVAQGRRAVDLGASFLVSPHLDLHLHTTLRNDGVLHIPGAATPSEVQSAARIGCDLVKLFPAGSLGIDYLKALRGPFPAMQFIATGGVDIPDAQRWLAAGAGAVGIGGHLAPSGKPSADELEDLTRRARSLTSGLADDDGLARDVS